MDHIDIATFLRSGFLAQGNRPTLPDGRLLYLYDCSDDEFWCLVGLLKECGVPSGYDFRHYRQRWQMLRQELQSRRQHLSTAHQWIGFWSEWTRDLDWTIRGFVLCASAPWASRPWPWVARPLISDLSLGAAREAPLANPCSISPRNG